MKRIIVSGMAFICATSISKAAITSEVINGNNLIVTTTNGEDCILSIDSGFVKVNGVDPDTGPLAVGGLGSFQFNGDALANRIDTSALDKTTYPSFGSIIINGGDGADTFVGSEQNETIRLDEGIDTIESFGGGIDFYFWSPGDGNESVSNSGGSGNYWFTFEGTSGSENVDLQSSGNSIILSELNSSESITLSGFQSLNINFGTGIDHGSSSDLSSVTGYDAVSISKTGGELVFDASQSMKRHVFTISPVGGTYDLKSSPQTNSLIQLATGFSQNSFNFELKKENEVTKILVDSPETDISLTGFSTINLNSSNGADTYLIEDIQDVSLTQISVNPGNGADSLETVFMENIFLRHRDDATNLSDSVILDARNFPLILNNTNGRYESPGFRGFYEPSNVDNITINNAGVLTDDKWLVE